MLAFSNDYYGLIFRATQSVELFCAYEIMGITSKFLSDIEFGLRGFSIEKLFLFSESLNLSTEYILFGTGPSINDRIFLQSINKCPEEKKEYLLLILNKIIESYNIDTKTV